MPALRNAAPKLLVTMALDGLARRVAALIAAGDDPADHVWAFFDARVRPGRTAAMLHLQGGGASPEQAAHRVDASIKASRAAGSIFAFGVMTTTRGLLDLLAALGGNESGLAPVRRWAEDPVPSGWFRLAVIAGSTTQLQLVGMAGDAPVPGDAAPDG